MLSLSLNKTRVGIIWFVDFCYNRKRYRVSTQTGDRKLVELFLKDIRVTERYAHLAPGYVAIGENKLQY